MDSMTFGSLMVQAEPSSVNQRPPLDSAQTSSCQVQLSTTQPYCLMFSLSKSGLRALLPLASRVRVLARVTNSSQVIASVADG